MAKISWAGQSCFQISVSQAKDVSSDIVIDPFSDEYGLKLPNLSADIVLSTHGHNDHNHTKAVKGDPFIVEGPGEYEIKGVFIQGVESYHDNENGKERGKNTIYIIEVEGMRICHLGDLGQHQLTDEQLQKIDRVDVLMIPVGGGGYTISAVEAQKIISQIEPKIVIPMHYALPKLKAELDDVAKFLKTMGKTGVTPVDKLTIKAKELPKEGATEIVLLTA